MRVVSILPHPHIRISILAWNGKFLLKFERPAAEQVYKLPEDLATEAEVKSFITASFMEGVVERFIAMESALETRMQEFSAGK